MACPGDAGMSLTGDRHALLEIKFLARFDFRGIDGGKEDAGGK